MSETSFSIPTFRSTELQEADFPVDIRRRNDLSLVARTLLSASVPLDPGQYVALARLPAGPEIQQAFEIGEDTRRTIQLDIPPEDTSSEDALERFNYLSSSIGVSPGDDYSDLDAIGLVAYQGNLFDPGTVRRVGFTGTHENLEGKRQYTCGFQDAPDPSGPFTLQIGWGATTPLNVCLPIVRKLVFEVSEEGDGATKLDIHLENPAAEAMLGYMQISDWSRVEALSQSTVLSAERLLQQKTVDTIGATVGAYALLRLAQLDRLHDWTENLRNWFPWLPDGAAIRGEHLARLGDHELALEAFLGLRNRGLPLFQDGLSYALSRLALYLESSSYRLGTDAARELLDHLRRFGQYVNYDQTITMFEGEDLLHPESPVFPPPPDFTAPPPDVPTV